MSQRSMKHCKCEIWSNQFIYVIILLIGTCREKITWRKSSCKRACKQYNPPRLVARVKAHESLAWHQYPLQQMQSQHEWEGSNSLLESHAVIDMQININGNILTFLLKDISQKVICCSFKRWACVFISIRIWCSAARKIIDKRISTHAPELGSFLSELYHCGWVGSAPHERVSRNQYPTAETN